ncbi:MAG TPA: hypothetical protein ENJ08_12215 [Gammaproteobacteria bacterium]|nr:hypothetical protein [Gammaproteobacteria bacterium]
MSLFNDQAAIVSEMRDERLIAVAQSYFPDITLSDSYIYNKVLAAEVDAEERLRVFFEPVEVYPEGTPQSELDAIPPTTRYIEEPAYDWDPEFFRGERWGFINTRHRPVIAVDSIRFVYPSTDVRLYQFPNEWIHVDFKYGHIRIVPMGDGSLPLNAWLLQVHGGGRTVPHMIRVRYRTGLKNARRDYPHLIDLIKKMAVIRILDDQFLPQSGSISADGLSESVSIDTKNYKESVAAEIDSLRQFIHGVSMVLL